MGIKKSELYSSLRASCDELRRGMDASQYNDYVLVLLFIKYVSDKYADEPYASITVPKGAGFKDMVALKSKSDIGESARGWEQDNLPAHSSGGDRACGFNGPLATASRSREKLPDRQAHS